MKETNEHAYSRQQTLKKHIKRIPLKTQLLDSEPYTRTHTHTQKENYLGSLRASSCLHVSPSAIPFISTNLCLKKKKKRSFHREIPRRARTISDSLKKLLINLFFLIGNYTHTYWVLNPWPHPSACSYSEMRCHLS